MATGALDNANSQEFDTELDAFIPELWSDEVIGAYKSNLVLANLVTRINHKGKKGDLIHIPTPGRTAANSFGAHGTVVLNQNTATNTDVTIDQHFEWSMLISDHAMAQALGSQRSFYTDDAGYALARVVDWHLHVEAGGFQGGTIDSTPGDPGSNVVYAGSGAVIGSDGTTAWDPTGSGNGTALADAGIRKMIQTLDDADVPLSDRSLVIPPVEKKNLLGVSRFTEQAFVGEAGAGNSIRNGLIGDIYGIPVFVSSNCTNVVDTGGTNSFRAGILMHKSGLALAEQIAVRMQTQYKQEFLATLITGDTLFGVAELRDNAGVVFIVPA